MNLRVPDTSGIKRERETSPNLHSPYMWQYGNVGTASPPMFVSRTSPSHDYQPNVLCPAAVTPVHLPPVLSPVPQAPNVNTFSGGTVYQSHLGTQYQAIINPLVAPQSNLEAGLMDLGSQPCESDLQLTSRELGDIQVLQVQNNLSATLSISENGRVDVNMTDSLTRLVTSRFNELTESVNVPHNRVANSSGTRAKGGTEPYAFDDCEFE